jgi:hypothetical protein
METGWRDWRSANQSTFSLQPFLFLESAVLAPRDNLPCNDGADDDVWYYYY